MWRWHAHYYLLGDEAYLNNILKFGSSEYQLVSDVFFSRERTTIHCDNRKKSTDSSHVDRM
jgi:hypothetical protein